MFIKNAIDIGIVKSVLKDLKARNIPVIRNSTEDTSLFSNPITGIPVDIHLNKNTPQVFGLLHEFGHSKTIEQGFMKKPMLALEHDADKYVLDYLKANSRYSKQDVIEYTSFAKPRLAGHKTRVALHGAHKYVGAYPKEITRVNDFLDNVARNMPYKQMVTNRDIRKGLSKISPTFRKNFREFMSEFQDEQKLNPYL